VACRLLAQALEKTGHPEAAAGALEKARLCRVKNIGAENSRLRQIREESADRSTRLRHTIETRRAEAEAKRKALEESGLPKDQEFVIVSGLPRSGTSLMMQMLRAGGLEPMTDGHRAPDEDNPEGYWEWEEIRQLPRNPLLIEKAHGKAVKVIAALLPALPPKHTYKILFMTRPVEEVVLSQATMLQRRGTAQRATTEHLQNLQRDQVATWLQALRASPRVSLLEVPYPDLVARPETWRDTIATFLGPAHLPNPAAMPAAVRPKLHRNKLA
jgi:hypothetical protein